MIENSISLDKVIEFLQLTFSKQGLSLDAVEKKILEGSWNNIPYEEMNIPNYSLGYLKTNIAHELWKKVTTVLQKSNLISDNQTIKKKNFRGEIAEIVKLYYSNNLINQTINNRFKITGLRSQGVISNTYIGEHLRVPPERNQCLIKQLKINTNENTTIKFNREVAALSELRWHPQIPYLLDHCTHETGYFVVYEYIRGYSLSEELSEEKLSEPWNETKTINLLHSILDILKFIHEHNILHRDIRPSNLIKKRNGEIVLINFGSIKMLADNDIRTFFGTPGYMAPEQSYGTPSRTSDIFALGMLGIQAITGLPPKQIKTNCDRKIIWDKQVSISEDLKNILENMTEYDLQKRYQSAEEVLKDLLKLT